MSEIALVPIRYDGKDAEAHLLELYQFGESVQGLARIIGVVSHFAVTGQYAKQRQALDVRVLIGEPQAQCLSFQAVIRFTQDQQLFAGGAGTVIGVLLTWLFNRASGRSEEMKALKDSLDKAIEHLAGQNSAMVPRLLKTLEKMADSLSPSIRAAVAPVGSTCSSMRIGDGPVIDEATAQAIRSIEADEVTGERDWKIYITELDREALSAKVRLVGDEEIEETVLSDRRLKAVITDPQMQIHSNDYVEAFAANEAIVVRAKATLKNGEIQTLYISDTVKL